MPSALVKARHEVTGRARYWGAHALTRISRDNRVDLGRRLRASDAGRTALGRAAEWYGRAPLTIETGPAAGMYVDTSYLPLDHAHAGAILRGSLEPTVHQAMIRTVRPGSTFFDIGANVGYFTLVGARMVGPSGRVVAFDPVPVCAAAVASNIALNQLDHTSIRAVAVGDHAGQARLQVVEEASWSCLSDTGSHENTEEEIDVEMVKLDDLVASGELPPPDVLKIDTEGAEIMVLEGMRETLARHGSKVICELHDTNAAFSALMDEIGYRAVDLDGPFPVIDSPPDIHVLAEPRD